MAMDKTPKRKQKRKSDQTFTSPHGSGRYLQYMTNPNHCTTTQLSSQVARMSFTRQHTFYKFNGVCLRCLDHIVKPSFCCLRRQLSGTSSFLVLQPSSSSFLGAIPILTPSSLGGSHHIPAFQAPQGPAFWGFVPASWVPSFLDLASYIQLPRTSHTYLVILQPALTAYFGYHTSFLSVAAFRHSFGQTQLCGHASFLITFVNFKILVEILFPGCPGRMLCIEHVECTRNMR